VTLTFDLLTERLLWSICVPRLVLIAQAIFLLECRQTDRQRDATERPTHASGYTADVGNHNSIVVVVVDVLVFGKRGMCSFFLYD